LDRMRLGRIVSDAWGGQRMALCRCRRDPEARGSDRGGAVVGGRFGRGRREKMRGEVVECQDASCGDA
jgi:hypothetical protein